MNLILFGFKGCGKTHFGKRLAEMMRRPFIDTDDLASQLYAQRAEQRRTTDSIYREMGRERFRALESEAILTMKSVENSIIALGGGAVLDPANVSFLKTLGTLVYLEASPETVRKRMSQGPPPAFLDDTPFLEMIQERKPIYESISARRIDVDALGVAGAIAALCSILLLEEPLNGF